MHARRVHCVHRMHAWKHGGDERARELVNELAEHRVLLRRAPHDRERPDRALTMMHRIHPEHGELVRPRVVAEVITERTFQLRLRRTDRAHDAEVRVRVDVEPRALRHPDAASVQRARERDLRQPLWQRHHRRDRHRRRTADEHAHGEAFTARDRGGVMHAEAAMNLVVQAHLAVLDVVVAGELDAVHAEVGVTESLLLRVLGVHLRQRDERTAVVGPGRDLRQVGERDLVREDRAATNGTRQEVHRDARQSHRAPHIRDERTRVNPRADQRAHAVERIAKDEAHALHRAEQVRREREPGAAHVLEEQRRTAEGEHASLDLRGLEERVDLFRHAAQVPSAVQVVDARAEGFVAHGGVIVSPHPTIHGSCARSC